MRRHHPHRRDPADISQLTDHPKVTALTQGIVSATPVPPSASTSLSIISEKSVSLDPTASLTFAASSPVLTVVTSTIAYASTLPDGSVSYSTAVQAVSITNPSQYASITSALALSTSRTSTSSTRTSSSPPTATATAQKSSTSNLSSLIPAIVVPIAVVLLGSFALFWCCMRRRHRREIKSQPDIAMAGKGEKLSSRSNSSRSASTSFRAQYEKATPLTTVSDFTARRAPPPPPTEQRYSLEDIGVARPLTPKDAELPSSRSPNMQFESFTREPRSYQNFSGLRPSTARRPSKGEESQGRSRSNSSPSKKTLPNRDPYSQGPAPLPLTGPSPTFDFHTSPPPAASTGLPINPRPANTPLMRDPSPTMSHTARANPPARLAPLTPGAFNGASPISQYSPIVKDIPNIAAISAKRSPPSPLRTDLANKRSESPYSAGTTGLTEENMRIARLANSSRLGFNGEPSPKLPPPATRSQLIPEETSHEEHDGYFGQDDHKADHDRGSMVSAPDEYEDIDAKSDVSSLNELERFEFESKPNSRVASEIHNYFGDPSGGSGNPYGDVGTSSSHGKW